MKQADLIGLNRSSHIPAKSAQPSVSGPASAETGYKPSCLSFLRKVNRGSEVGQGSTFTVMLPASGSMVTAP